MRTDIRQFILFSAAAAALVGAFVIGPVPQDPAYHLFVDRRELFSIPNFWNVVTNAPFVVIGAMGMVLVARGKACGGLSDLRAAYFVFFLGVFAVGFGSAYYHFHPDNQTLFWDRVPMTIAFMGFFSAVLGEHISTETCETFIWPLIALGICSVLYWYVSEKNGLGDIRLYALVQYLPALLLPMILFLYRSRLVPGAYLWLVLGAYLAAKIAESLDGQLYAAIRVLSGHSIKHLAAAGGAYLFYVALRRREPAADSQET